MSRENIEIARSLHEAFNSRDVQGVVELMDSEVEFVPILAKLEGTVYRGPEEVRRWLEELNRDWIHFQTKPEEFRDLDDVVLTIGTWNARGRTSGVSLDSQPGAWLTRIRGGKIVRHETFTDRGVALEAAGMNG